MRTGVDLSAATVTTTPRYFKGNPHAVAMPGERGCREAAPAPAQQQPEAGTKKAPGQVPGAGMRT